MQGITGSELSPRKAEYLKYIYARGDVVKTGDIAAHFLVAPSTVTKALSESPKRDISSTPLPRVRLTPAGISYARFLFRRHRIVALVLSRYGLEPDEACREATKIEGLCLKRPCQQDMHVARAPDNERLRRDRARSELLLPPE